MKQPVFLISVTAIIAFTLGMLSAPIFSPEESKISVDPEFLQEVKSEYYTCPMHPHIHQQHAGDCPICGMSLVSKQAGDLQALNAGSNSRAEIYVEPAVINNFGIKTAGVSRDSIHRNIKLYGYINKVEKPEDVYLKSPVSGVVAFINHSEEVNKFYKNEVIISLESDKILQLQQQYLTANNENDVRNMRVLKQQLSTLGYSFDELNALIQTNKPSNIYHLRYPATGLLTESNVSLGQKIEPGEQIGTLKPLYSISAFANVYETQWIWLKAGQRISMSIRRFPGLSWEGEVSKVEDLGQSSTSAVKLFADFKANDKLDLRLGMQTEMTVYAESKSDVLLVPSSAVIRTGSKSVVVIAKRNGRFQPVDVVTGLDNDKYVEIVSGLNEGAKVVVSGQFLLDSESELRAEISRLGSTAPGTPVKGPEH
ncbi:MAG: efflux RND transporter periplasmic adaptor subunit [Gammaproteobacteria bacterium]